MRRLWVPLIISQICVYPIFTCSLKFGGGRGRGRNRAVVFFFCFFFVLKLKSNSFQVAQSRIMWFSLKIVLICISNWNKLSCLFTKLLSECRRGAVGDWGGRYLKLLAAHFWLWRAQNCSLKLRAFGFIYFLYCGFLIFFFGSLPAFFTRNSDSLMCVCVYVRECVCLLVLPSICLFWRVFHFCMPNVRNVINFMASAHAKHKNKKRE